MNQARETSTSARFIRIAALYLIVGVTMGIVMGIRQQFSLAPVHAHVNLLGWATLVFAINLWLTVRPAVRGVAPSPIARAVT
jgi:hypothetical protein